MSKKSPRKHSVEFKAKVAIEAIRGDLSISQISSKYGVHSSQINRWKKRALDGLKSSFSQSHTQAQTEQQNIIDGLYKRIGELSCENDFLKKSAWD